MVDVAVINGELLEYDCEDASLSFISGRPGSQPCIFFWWPTGDEMMEARVTIDAAMAEYLFQMTDPTYISPREGLANLERMAATLANAQAAVADAIHSVRQQAA